MELLIMSTKQSKSEKKTMKLTPEDKAKFERMEHVKSLKQRYRSIRVGSPTRTTFTLQEKTIKALNEMDEMFGLAPREIFRECLAIRGCDFSNIDESKRTNEKQKKTYIIDDFSLNTFKRVAKKNNISRDYCVELFIEHFHNTFMKIHEEDVLVVRRYKTKINEVFEIINDLEKDSHNYFGEDHGVTEALNEAYDIVVSISESMDNYIEKGVWKQKS